MRFAHCRRALLLLEYYVGEWRSVPMKKPGGDEAIDRENRRNRTTTCKLVRKGLVDVHGAQRQRRYRTLPSGEQEIVRIRAALAAGADPRWWPNGYPKNRKPYSYGKRARGAST